MNTRCQDIAAALVDERLPRPPGLEEHLRECAACRALAGLHASATSLRLPEAPAPAPLPREAILGEVRRRQHRRRVVGSVTASAAVVALVLLVSPRERTRVPLEIDPVVGGPSEFSLQAEQPRPSERTTVPTQEEAGSLAALFGEVHGYTRTDPSLADEMYEPFGALTAWVRPPDSTALDSEPFRTALVAFHVPK